MIFTTKQLHLLILCTFPGFDEMGSSEMGNGKTGFDETGFSETGLNQLTRPTRPMWGVA